MRMPEIPYRLERFLIAGVVLLLNGGALAILSFYEVPAQNRDVIFQLVGGLSALAGMVVGGYFRDTKVEIKDGTLGN